MRATVVTLSLSLVLIATTSLAQEGGAPAEAAPAEAAVSADPLAVGDAAMSKRTLKGYEAALKAYDEALEKNPTDPKVKLKVVDALNAIMRVKTNGNLITLEGTADDAKNKKIWKELGTRSEKLAKEVVEAMPNDMQANLLYAESYMYKSASFGIIKAIMQGSADQYQSNAKKLIKLDKKADGGVGYVYLGGFFMVAPWPLSDDEESAKNYDLALKMNDKSIRNRYYRGLRAVNDEDWKVAKEHLQYAVDKPCSLPSEKDFCKYMKKQAQRALDVANKH